MSWTKALLTTTLALFLTCGFYLTLSYLERAPLDPAPITTIVQTGPLKEALKTTYLAECLGLSADPPTSLAPEVAESILLQNPLIKKASVSLLNPETLYIDYTVRTPQFIYGDFENLAIDGEGNAFPLFPYFTPKNLPTLYLGAPSPEKVTLALALLPLVDETLQSIDLTHAFDLSLGKREIVITLGNGWTHFLRLPSKGYEEALTRYHRLSQRFAEKDLVVDLRLPKLAYLTLQK